MPLSPSPNFVPPPADQRHRFTATHDWVPSGTCHFAFNPHCASSGTSYVRTGIVVVASNDFTAHTDGNTRPNVWLSASRIFDRGNVGCEMIRVDRKSTR